MAKIKAATLRYALGVLNAQGRHAENGNREQEAYYRGLRDMLEIIVSDAYTHSNYIVGGCDRKHGILYENGELFFDEVEMQVLSAK